MTLAELLLEKEVIFKKDLEVIFGSRPFDKEEVIEKIEEIHSSEASNIENSSETTE